MRLLLAALALVIATTIGSVATSAPRKKVLVVTSNAAVPKFRQVEEAFTTAFDGVVARVDLGNEADADARVRIALLAENPDAVFCVGSRAYIATSQATRRAPVVFTSTVNSQRLAGGDNVFGVASEMPADYQLTAFRHLFPGLQRIGLLYSERFNEETARTALASGRDVKIEVIARAVHRPGDVADAARELLLKVDALWVVPDPVVLANERTALRLLELAKEAKVPVFSYDDAFVEVGALLAMTSDQSTIGTQAAMLVEDVIAGRRVERSVIAPAGSQIVLNTRSLEHSRLALSREALSMVNRFVK